MKKAFDYLDTALDSFVDKNVRRISPLETERYLKSRRPHLRDPTLSYLIDGLDSLHNNVAALLTHISAMIAALGIILIVFQDSKATQLAIFLEIIGYANLAVLCLLCLRFRDVNQKSNEMHDDKYIELFLRFYLYKRNI